MDERNANFQRDRALSSPFKRLAVETLRTAENDHG